MPFRDCLLQNRYISTTLNLSYWGIADPSSVQNRAHFKRSLTSFSLPSAGRCEQHILDCDRIWKIA